MVFEGQPEAEPVCVEVWIPNDTRCRPTNLSEELVKWRAPRIRRRICKGCWAVMQINRNPRSEGFRAGTCRSRHAEAWGGLLTFPTIRTCRERREEFLADVWRGSFAVRRSNARKLVTPPTAQLRRSYCKDGATSRLEERMATRMIRRASTSDRFEDSTFVVGCLVSVIQMMVETGEIKMHTVSEFGGELEQGSIGLQTGDPHRHRMRRRLPIARMCRTSFRLNLKVQRIGLEMTIPP